MTATLRRDPGAQRSPRRGEPPRRGRLSSFPLLACCLLLTVLPFTTAPGRIISDTKFELAVSPGRFLSSALTLWDPQQFGGLLNQAVGYLFPMGPFFELLRLQGVPGWVAQRAWLVLLLLAAFGGTFVLAGRLRIGTPRSRLAAGLAYALSPMALSMIGQTSGEFLPMAMLPWIIIPLTDMRPWVADAEGRPGAARRVRAVALSAVAVGLASGMNAASTLAVLIPAAIYILTRPGAGSKIRMMAWWTPAVALVSLSWAIPLLLLSKYGVSIVPFTESAQVTSSTTSLLNIFRGTESWIGYQATGGQPIRPLAFQLATSLGPALVTGLLAALGLAGVVHREIRERGFLLWTALAGVVLISLGYISGLGSPAEHILIGLINGPGSPFRNLWKFDPLVRLPLALGLAHLIAAARVPRLHALLVMGAVLGIGTVATLGFATGLASPGSFSQVPPYWVSAASWLSARTGDQAVLVEPGAPFSQYLWGAPMDDVLQALTNVDYAERNLGVLGSVANERLLNAVDQQLAAGDGSAGLTQVLARMGVKYVLIRNDLSSGALGRTWMARYHDALAASPGMTLAAQFGPLAGSRGSGDAVTSFGARYPAVQIYQVAGAEPAAVVQPAADTLRLYGAPESEITLANEGLLDGQPVLLNGDGAGQPVAASVNTDSLRRRVLNFGELRSNFSPTLTAAQPADTFLSSDDFTAPGWTPYLSVARYSGIQNVTASSSDANIKAAASQSSTGTLPYSAVDGNLATMWESGAFNGPRGQWLQLDFDSKVNPGTIMVAFADSSAVGPPVTRVSVTSATGEVTEAVQNTGNYQPLQVPPGASRWLRVTVTGLDARRSAPRLGTQVGIADISVPGVSASRTIVAPTVPGDPSAVVLAKAQPYQPGCMLTSQRWVCSPALRTVTEEQYGFDHTFTEPAAARGLVSGSAILTSPSLADRYALAGRNEPVVAASSAYTTDPQDQAVSAFDGDPATAWIASPSDTAPKLTVSWGTTQTVSQVTIKRPPGASGTAQVLITGSAGQQRGALIGAGGVVRFAPMQTTRLSFTFTTDQAPLQVSDVVIPGVKPVRLPAAAPFRLPCGQGPQVAINGKVVGTRVSGTIGALLTGRPVQFTACRTVALGRGANEVTEPHADTFDVQDVVIGTARGLAAAAPARAATTTPAAVQTWGSSQRTILVAAAKRSYLEVNENFNAGWQAVIGGQRLQPVQLDGWKQAWVLPAGTDGLVTLTYQPESLYRDAVAIGLTALALTILIAFSLRPRRALRPLEWSPAAIRRRRGGLRQAGRPRLGLIIAGLAVTLPAAGLILGGYRGALAVPAAAAAIAALARSWPRTSVPWLLGGLLMLATVIGVAGARLVSAGGGGLSVSLLSNVVPEFLGLMVVGGIAGALISGAMQDLED